jgi:hypothetical protein
MASVGRQVLFVQGLDADNHDPHTTFLRFAHALAKIFVTADKVCSCDRSLRRQDDEIADDPRVHAFLAVRCETPEA